jgi:general secretion pathway protein N
MPSRSAAARLAFFVAMFLFAIIVLLPLHLAVRWFGLDQAGLAAREASGSIWIGALSEAQLGPAPIGNVEVRLAKLPLLIGRTRFELERQELDAPLRGALTLAGQGFRLNDFTGQVRLGASLSPLPVASLDLDRVSVHFDDGLCEKAEGRIRASVARDMAGLSLLAGLGGSPRCAGGAALIALASQSGMERLDLRLLADGRYRADFIVRTADPSLSGRLAAAGFRPSAAGQTLRIEGSF